MNRRLTIALVSVTALAASITFAQATKDNTKAPPKPAAPTAPAAKDAHDQAAQQLPKGVTEQDMKNQMVCMESGKPGPMQAKLMEGCGIWTGTMKFWMTPTADPQDMKSTSTITPIMDGRFVQVDVGGETPEGPFKGTAVYGYDNVAKQFQSTWIDNCGSGIMNGKGELSSDGTMTWTYNYVCPITHKPTVMREVQKHPTKDTCKIEMYAVYAPTGKEYKMMEITSTRKPGTGAVTNVNN